MKKLLPYAAVSAGLIMALGLGSLAAAADETELDLLPSPSITTEAPLPLEDETEDESGEDEGDGDEDGTDEESEKGGGLVCEFVPTPAPSDEAGTGEEGDGTGLETTSEDGDPLIVEEPAPEPTTPTIAEFLATGDIQCSGTGNERSASVALVPRFLAKSDLWTGREKGQAISEWAKGHANKKVKDEATSDESGDDSADEVETSSEPTTPGKSDKAGKSDKGGKPASPGKSGDAKSKPGKK